MKRIYAIGAAVILAVLFLVVAINTLARPAIQVTDDVCVEIPALINGEEDTLQSSGCNEPAPTNTPQPDPTNTPTIAPTASIEPTSTPTQTAEIEPYPEAPLCPTHDDRTYHGLWDSERGCHYDHTHGDNPHDLDYRLGTEIYGLMGGEISYPWQTVNADGYLENDLKHAGYIWHVRDNIPCPTSDPCITAFRALAHQHTIADASVRFHSYVFEGQTSDGGYFLLSGWMDFGDLHAPEGNRVVDVEGNHCGSESNPGNHKQHAIEGGDRAPSNIWYGRSRASSDPSVDRVCSFAHLGVSAHDPWIWTSQEEPYQGDYVCYPNPRCRVNATTFRIHSAGVNVNDLFPFIFGGSGLVDFNGWADRYGVPYEGGGGCTEPSLDCAPFILEGLQGAQYRTNTSHTAQDYRDYDVYFPDDNGRLQTSGWSQPVD